MKRLLLMATALLALTGAARADYLATSYSVVGGQSVVIGTPILENVLAGKIELHGPAGDLAVWCLDIFDHINLPYNYTVSQYTAGDVRPGMQTLDGTQLRRIASLMAFGETEVSAAAVQLAIWKVEYGAAFSLLGLGLGLQNEMNLALTNSLSGGLLDCPGCTLTVLSDAPVNPSQAFGFATPSAVPGPLVGAGLPGLVTAFGGLIALSRHRRRKTA